MYKGIRLDNTKEIKGWYAEVYGKPVIYNIDDPAIPHEIIPQALVNLDPRLALYDEMVEALERAYGMVSTEKGYCPQCGDGSGFTVKQVSERQYISRDMAIDAGDDELEGHLYSDNEFEQEQCQWCFEATGIKALLAKTKALKGGK